MFVRLPRHCSQANCFWAGMSGKEDVLWCILGESLIKYQFNSKPCWDMLKHVTATSKRRGNAVLSSQLGLR